LDFIILTPFIIASNIFYQRSHRRTISFSEPSSFAMRWSVSTSFLIAGLIDNVCAGLHHHHAHRHRHHHLMQRAEKPESRVDNVDNIIEEIVVESTTLTTTSTVFGNCAPTNTIFTTLTIVATRPTPMPHDFYPPAHNWTPAEHGYFEAFQAQWDQFPPQPEPTQMLAPKPMQPEPTSTTFKTKTIHKTATHTVKVTVYPEESPIPTPNAPPGTASDEEKAALAETLPENSLEEEKAVPAKRPPPPHPPHKPNGGPVNAVLDLPSEVLPGIPVVDEILPGPKPNPPSPVEWTRIPPAGEFSFNGFGGRTVPKGTEIHYVGNIGKPWGSNIIMVSEAEAHSYKYVAKFSGSNDEPWTVIVWNKAGPDGKLNGWYGKSALTFTLPPGETRYVAFDEDSEGAWGAAPGDHLPTDHWGGYSCTWGEFSFGDGENNGWSGWDVSAIQAQIAKQHVQGMSICQANGKGCSVITPGAEKVVDAYTESKKHLNGIGGAASPGPVRLDVLLDYRG
jgi:hypothetical protein